MNKQQLAAKIWASANEMRSKIEASEYKDYILGFIFYKFLSEKEVDILSDIVDFYEIPVLCYGLRTDFRNRLFPGSRRLMEIADVLEEVPTVCWCGRRAQCNTRYADGKIVREGAQIMLGANESYVALCRKHYKEGKLWKESL